MKQGKSDIGFAHLKYVSPIVDIIPNGAIIIIRRVNKLLKEYKIMKLLKILSLVGMVFFLCLLAQAEYSAVAQGEREILVLPSEGTIGDTIRVVGKGFNKSKGDFEAYAAIILSSEEATTDDDIDSDVTVYEFVAEGVLLNENGEFDISFELPAELNDGADKETVHVGTYYVYVCHYVINVLAPRISAVAEFDVILGNITIEPDRGTVGTSVKIIGTDFFSNEEIAINYDEMDLDIDSGDTKTDSSGEFTAYVIIPKSNAGIHHVAVIQLGNEVVAEFFVEPDVTINPTSGESGTQVTVLGTGFSRRENVVIYFGASEVAEIPTDRVGDFVATFSVPEFTAGLYKIEIDDGENIQTAKFTIISPPELPSLEPPITPAVIEINRLAGNVGAEIVVSGTGFVKDGTVTIEYDNEVVASTNTDARGIFMASFNIPISAHGGHVMKISDDLNTKELTFTVESEAPSKPNLLVAGPVVAEQDTDILLDWEDVMDDSMPVTYELQLASNDSFSAESILLEEKGLTDSEYLMDSSKIKFLRPRSSYYWRARAVDSAANAGEWAETVEIKIAAVTTMPGWLMYTLILLGGLFIFFIWYRFHQAEKRSNQKEPRSQGE